MSIAISEFQKIAKGNPMRGMETASEIRRRKLGILIDRYDGLAKLNVAIGWARTDPKLSQIRNANIRPGRDKPYLMGDAMAREIEDSLQLERGWLDTPESLTDFYADTRIGHVLKVMEQMPEWQLDQAIKIIDTIAQPIPAKNGTQG